MTKIREVPTNVDARVKRKQILDAAFEVFSRRGYNRATVDEIIAIADTGKGTVYNYFVNKEQLFYTLIKERSAPFEAALEKAIKMAVPPQEKIENVIKLFLQFFVENGNLWRVMMHEIRGLSCDIEAEAHMPLEQREKYQAWFGETIDLMGRAIQEGIDVGFLRECDVNKASYNLFAVVVTMVFQKFIEPDVETCAHGIAQGFFYGVAKR